MQSPDSRQLLPWIIPALFLIFWLVASSNGLVPDYLIPHPNHIAKTAYLYLFGQTGDGPFAGRFFEDFRASILRVVLGFGLAVLLGIPLGILSGRLAWFQKMMGTAINALRAVPGICWMPLALVWFGIGLRTTVFLVALASFFPIYLNSAAGARQVNPILFQSGAMMGIGRMRGIFHILIPGAMPQMMTGLRLGLGIAWAYLVLGELTGVPDGLGAVIMDARMLGRIDMVVLGIILIAVLGRISDLGLMGFMRMCFKSVKRTA